MVNKRPATTFECGIRLCSSCNNEYTNTPLSQNEPKFIPSEPEYKPDDLIIINQDGSIQDHEVTSEQQILSETNLRLNSRYSAAEVVLEKEQPESIQKEESKNILTINHDIGKSPLEPFLGQNFKINY